MIRKFISFVIVIFLAVFLFKFFFGSHPIKTTGADYVEINEILENSGRYDDELVRVKGIVVSSTNLGIKFYKINDGSGTIAIRSKDSVPSKGTEIKVTGKVEQYIKVSDMKIVAIIEKSSEILTERKNI